MSSRYISVRAAADYLGLSERAVRQRVARRTIPFIRIGRVIRFDVQTLDRWMARHKVGSLGGGTYATQEAGTDLVSPHVDPGTGVLPVN